MTVSISTTQCIILSQHSGAYAEPLSRPKHVVTCCYQMASQTAAVRPWLLAAGGWSLGQIHAIKVTF